MIHSVGYSQTWWKVLKPNLNTMMSLAAVLLHETVSGAAEF